MQPMVRNAGEALGVVAAVNLAWPPAGRFDSSVPPDTLHRIEQQMAGPVHPTAGKVFTRLRSPRWPEHLLGTIDRPGPRAAKRCTPSTARTATCRRPTAPPSGRPSAGPPCPAARSITSG